MTHTPTPWSDYMVDFGHAERERARACVNFFHGRDIPTERLEDGGFWEMVELLQKLAECHANYCNAFGPGIDSKHAVCLKPVRALLAKLGVEP